MKIEIDKSYRMYGKMGTMKRMKPVSGSAFVTNLIHAEIYTPKTAQDVGKMERELDFLKDQGVFEFRVVRKW